MNCLKYFRGCNANIMNPASFRILFTAIFVVITVLVLDNNCFIKEPEIVRVVYTDAER